ncbi:MDR family MFS transporter [Pararoseomonas sp. SCSIO 73927]|uniref:MDR family MFS transporter n=1 Tax=Pararoseomonas sp. SCSIO 73927 TaxID=3114537 RepID=UPI0030D2BAB6
MTAPPPRRPLILASVMVALFMVSIESTIVSTAMPQIAGRLGDLHLYSWVFAAFLLTQTAMTVVFGKLADIYGRRPVMLAGIGIFLVGSLLCGLAWSIPSLIVFRLVQGIGAGAVLPVAQTVVGDLYSAQERGKVQGWLASVWGLSSVLGPLAGGIIVERASWPWIFWINLPIGVLAAIGFARFLRETVVRERRPVDVVGAALLTLTVAALMAAVTDPGTPLSLVSAAVFLPALAGFLWWERRAADPVLDIALWARQAIATNNLVVFLGGAALIGLTTFLPMYVQGVLGRSALTAGFALTMTVLGWPVGAAVGARSFGRLGLRGCLLLGAALMPVGAVAFVLLGPGSSPVLAGAGSFVIGLGMGFLNTAAVVMVQEVVGWSQRGSATASAIFSRNLGSALGAAVLGGVLNLSLSRSLAGGMESESLRRLLEGGGGAVADAAVRTALDGALHLTFWAVLALSLGCLVVGFLVPPVVMRPRVPVAAPAD